MRRGRPLLFLGQIVCGWAVLRVAAQWLPALPAESPAPAGPFGPAPLVAQGRPAGAVATLTERRPSPRLAPALAGSAQGVMPVAGERPAAQRGGWSTPVADTLLHSSMAFAQETPGQHLISLAAMAPGRGQGRLASALPGRPAATFDPASSPGPGQRWSGSAWLLWRASGGSAGGPMLSASQAGLRIDRAVPLPAVPSLHAHARLSGPVDMPLAEGALGMSARPVRALPVSLAVEVRQRLADGGRTGAALYAAGGMEPRAVGAGLELDGYAQAGLVGLPGADGFVDGRLTLARPVGRWQDRGVLRLALTAEGAAQPGAARIDVGPQIEARLPLPMGAGTVRIAGGWRERVSGSARPGSGPAIIIATSF